MTAPFEAFTLKTGAMVELFDLDLSAVGGGVFYFVSGNLGDQAPVWRGHAYVPIPVQVQGFEMSSRGTLPQPTLSIARSDIVESAAIAFDDLRGCRLVRWRTFANYLDNGPTPNQDVYLPLDLYYIQRKSKSNKTTIEWQLGASIDQQGRKIPARLAVRDFCPWRYRIWNSSTSNFDYTKATCPYSGGAMFTFAGDSTGDPTQDVCGKRLEDCKKRFGDYSELPYGGFPGLSLT